jgi:hypothetical protein
MAALSLGESVSRDGAFTSRRGTGEGSVPGPYESEGKLNCYPSGAIMGVSAVGTRSTEHLRLMSEQPQWLH